MAECDMRKTARAAATRRAGVPDRAYFAGMSAERRLGARRPTSEARMRRRRYPS